MTRSTHVSTHSDEGEECPLCVDLQLETDVKSQDREQFWRELKEKDPLDPI
jgi:hypothetical protein